MTKPTIPETPRARRTRAKVVETSEAGGIQRITWAQPVTFNPHAVPRSRRSRREIEAVEHFLHGAICTPADWRRIDDIVAIFPPNKVREGKVHFGRVKPRQPWELHTPAECDAPRWAFLEKRRGELYDRLACAAGIEEHASCASRPAGTALVSVFGRRSRRGRAALKHDWYDLATAWKLSVFESSRNVPRGFFPKLARHLSFPEVGLRFTAAALKTATCEIEAAIKTVQGVIRNEYASRVQWGDMLHLAVIHSGLAPALAARRFPQAATGR
jgi:hypothetical protein